MAKKKPRIFLRVVRVSNDDEIQTVKSDDITVIKKSALGIVTGQTQTYRLDKDGGVIIPLNKWSDVYNINIKDKVSGKEYKIQKSKFENASNKDAWMRSYTQVLEDSRTPMRIDFYSMVKENAANETPVLRVESGIRYQIDFSRSSGKKPITGTTETVKGSDFEFNHTYTQEIPVLRDTEYRIYLVDKNRKPYNPHLARNTSPAALKLIIPKNKNVGKLYLVKYKLQTFLQFKVKTKSSSSTPNDVKVQLIDYKKTVVKTLKVDPKTGLTEKISADYKRTVQVLVAGKPVTARLDVKDSQGDVVPSPFDYLRTLTIPTMNIPTAINKPKHEAVLAGKANLPIIFDLETQELILLEPKDYKELSKVGSELSGLVAQCHINRRRLAQSLEPSATVTVKDIVNIEKELKASEDLLKVKLNIDLTQKALIKEVYTTQSYVEGGKTKIKLVRNHLNRNHYKVYYKNRVNKDGTKIDIKSSIRGSSLQDTPKNIDKIALKDSLDKIKRQASFKQYGERHFKDLDIFNELLNVSGNELSKTIYESKKFKTEVSAQWLRAIGGWTGSAAINSDPSKGKVGGELGFDVSGKLVLCEANINNKAAYPSLQGWQLAFNHKATGEIDLGAIRFIIECDIHGFVGAKAGISGAVSISFNGNKQEVQAIEKDPALSASQLYGPVKTINKPKFDPILDDKHFADAPVNKDLNIGVTAFVGAETGITPSASLEWLNSDTNTFKALAKLSVTGAVSAGIGVEGCFLVLYADGKFRIKAKAALCFGVGAKGAALFDVNIKLMLEFSSWIYRQLLTAEFRVLSFIMEGAFLQLSQFFVLMLGRKNDISESLNNIADLFFKFNISLDKARERNKLASFILNNTDDTWLKVATPEAKGILLYQLTRHGIADKVIDEPDTTTNWNDFDIDYLPNRKAAIIKIFETVVIKREWQNVLQHMHPNGLKGDLGKNEGDIIRLLNYGKFLDKNVQEIFDYINSRNIGAFESDKDYSKYITLYLKMRAKVAPRYPDGIEVVKNTSPKYDIYINYNNSNDYRFYAAKSPEKYDPVGFEEDVPTSRSVDDDQYLV